MIATSSPATRPSRSRIGEGIEQRLRGMFVRAVAGIDHARVQPLRQKLRGAGRGVPQHDHIRMQRFEIARGVLERLAFRQRRGRR